MNRRRGRNRIRVWAALGLLLAALPAAAQDPAGEVEPGFDCGAAHGMDVLIYRAAYVPKVFAEPSRAWFYADIAALAALTASGAWLVLSRRPARWITRHMTVAFLYFGLFRGGCLCPVGATTNAALGVAHPEWIGRGELAIFLIPLAAALICGRVFCGAVCPLGAVQELVARRAARPLPRPLHLALLAAPVALLVLTVRFALGNGEFLACRLDVFKPLFFEGHTLAQKAGAWLTGQFTEPGLPMACGRVAWTWLGIALLAGRLVPRVFCRYVCPYGVLLGVFSVLAFRRRRIDPEECRHCETCQEECPVQAIRIAPASREARLSVYQCIQCGRCSRLCKPGTVRAGHAH